VVVDNCDWTAEDLREELVRITKKEDIKVTGTYYPKQRIVVVPSAEHVKQVLFALHIINDRLEYAKTQRAVG
jgi:hypothetical protein